MSRLAGRAIAALVFGICAGEVPALAGEHRSGPIPFSQIGKDITGATLADISFHSPVPVLIVAGATYKLADLAHDIGDAAVDRQDKWLGAEIVLANKDARKLKEIGLTGGDLNGPDANAIKDRLKERTYTMTSAQRSPYGYTAAVIVRNVPYAVAKVGADKLLEKTIGLMLKYSGVSKLIDYFDPFPESINWAMNYGGPLEDLEKGAGWGKLGARARAAQKAAEDAVIEQEELAVANYLRSDRTANLQKLAASSLSNIYQRVLAEHPSQSRSILVADFRLEAARQVAIRPAPVPVMAAPSPPEIQDAEPDDPVTRTIETDDTSVQHNYRPAPSQPRIAQSAPATEAPDPADEAWRARMHAGFAVVGDGKTFVLCTPSCPSRSNSSWDGAAGQTLGSR